MVAYKNHAVFFYSGLPAFQLGLLFFCPGTTSANLFWYCFLLRALPVRGLFFYIFATLGVCFLTLPALARVPCCFPMIIK